MNLKEFQIFAGRQAERVLSLATFFRGYNPLPPLFIELLLTYKCNLNCDFCYQAREKRKTFPDMNIEDCRTIERNIKESFKLKPRVHLFGGEPTVNDDFRAILNYFSDKGYRISITTNGIDIDKYIGSFLQAKGLKEINLSLNTMDFEKYLSLLNLFKEKVRQKKIFINLACPITGINQHNLIEIIKKFENSYAGCITFQHTTFTKNYETQLDSGRIAEQVREIKRNKYKISVLFLPDIEINDITSYYGNPSFPRAINKCIFSWIVLFIQPNGNIIPCDEMDIVMGNAKQESLRKVWNNSKFMAFRREIQKQGISYPICQRCCHRRYY